MLFACIGTTRDRTSAEREREREKGTVSSLEAKTAGRAREEKIKYLFYNSSQEKEGEGRSFLLFHLPCKKTEKSSFERRVRRDTSPEPFFFFFTSSSCLDLVLHLVYRTFTPAKLKKKMRENKKLLLSCVRQPTSEIVSKGIDSSERLNR